MSNVNPELVERLKRKILFEEKKNLKEKENKRAQTVSYTHLTLPTKLEV